MKKYTITLSVAFCLAMFLEIIFRGNPFLRLTSLSILSLVVLLYAMRVLGEQPWKILLTFLVFGGLMLLGYYKIESLYAWNPLIIAAAGFATIVKAAAQVNHAN